MSRNIDRFRKLIDDRSGLQVLLMNLYDLNYPCIQVVISTSKYMVNVNEFYNFYRLLSYAAQGNYPNRHIYLRLLISFRKQALEYLTPFTAISIHHQFTAYFLKENFILPEHLVEALKCGLLEANIGTFFFFFPEIGQQFSKHIPYSLQNAVLPFCECCEKDRSIFFKNRIVGHNSDMFAKLIRQDKLSLFKASEFSPTTPIPFSWYETGPLIQNIRYPTAPICYAAYYGAENIFNYLFNELDLDNPHLLEFAIYGGNENIINAVLSKHSACLTSNHLIFAAKHWKRNVFYALAPSLTSVNRPMMNLLLMQNYNFVNMKDFLYQDDKCIIENQEDLTNFFRMYCLHGTKEPEFLSLFNLAEIDLNETDSNGQTIAHYLSISGNAFFLKLIISKYSLDLNVIDEEGKTPLMYAIENKHVTMVKYLLQINSVQINQVGKIGTAIFYAIQTYEPSIFKLLLQHPKILKNIRNSENETPFEFAEKLQNKEAIELLQTA